VPASALTGPPGRHRVCAVGGACRSLYRWRGRTVPLCTVVFASGMSVAAGGAARSPCAFAPSVLNAPLSQTFTKAPTLANAPAAATTGSVIYRFTVYACDYQSDANGKSNVVVHVLAGRPYPQAAFTAGRQSEESAFKARSPSVTAFGDIPSLRAHQGFVDVSGGVVYAWAYLNNSVIKVHLTGLVGRVATLEKVLEAILAHTGG
jgi:hypothetical protein